jgi:hypothetical protein
MNENDQCALVLEQLLQVAVEHGRDAMRGSDSYDNGKVFAYYDLLTVAIETAQTLGLDLSKHGLLDFDPDNELIPRKKAA